MRFGTPEGGAVTAVVVTDGAVTDAMATDSPDSIPVTAWTWTLPRTGVKRTLSPGLSNAGGSLDSSHITASAVPISRHPPELSRGYTPLNRPANPTAPAGT